MARHNNSGSFAEACVAKYLKGHGYEIIDTNWKTKWCEIDIVAKNGGCISFVEVKFRTSLKQGSGLEYITSKKLSQMKRAAKSWVELNDWAGEYILSAAEVSGENFDIEFVEQI